MLYFIEELNKMDGDHKRRAAFEDPENMIAFLTHTITNSIGFSRYYRILAEDADLGLLDSAVKNDTSVKDERMGEVEWIEWA